MLSDNNVSMAWHHLCLEVLVTLSETAPAMVRKVSNKFIPVLSECVVDMFFFVFLPMTFKALNCQVVKFLVFLTGMLWLHCLVMWSYLIFSSSRFDNDGRP